MTLINQVRGELALSVDGVARRLCLTLGALAEIETALECDSLSELDRRMRALSAADMVTVIRALLIGGGEVEAASRIEDADIAPAEAASAIAEAFRRALDG